MKALSTLAQEQHIDKPSGHHIRPGEQGPGRAFNGHHHNNQAVLCQAMCRSMTDEHEGSLINFPLPSIIVSDTDEVVWYVPPIVFHHRPLIGDQILDLRMEHLADIIAEDL